MTKKRSSSQPRVSLATDTVLSLAEFQPSYANWLIMLTNLTTEKYTGNWTSQFLLLCLTTWFDWCKATKLLNNVILALAVEWDNSDIVTWKWPYFLKTSLSPKQGTSAHYISNHPLVHKWVTVTYCSNESNTDGIRQWAQSNKLIHNIISLDKLFFPFAFCLRFTQLRGDIVIYSNTLSLCFD